MKSIVIVGGGTAGWMAAAFLNKTLRQPNGEGPLPITLVESPAIGTIGVGEATIPSLRSFLQNVDIPEWRFLSEANASFKHGIRFLGWRTAAEHGGIHEYYHPFEIPPAVEGHGLGTHWLALRDRGVAHQPSFWEAVSIQPALSRALKSPKAFDALPYQSWLPYAYHLDALAFANLLKTVAIERGVTHCADDVVAVHKDGEGSISHVTTRNHGDLRADFFIDCSGFSALLIERCLGEPFESWSDHLLCDRAVACQVPHPADPPAIRPYTTATAKEAGWIWEIDLFTRRGNGYVYSSRHSGNERAARVLCEHLGLNPDTAPLRNLTMRIGQRRNMWVRNCLSLGLAAAFIEPLESTGIHFIELGLGVFLDYAGGGEAMPYFAQQFNAKMRRTLEETRDFLQIHYILTDREDSAFWRDYRHEVRVPDALRHQLDLWTFKLPSVTDFPTTPGLFGAPNYSYILAGMHHLPATAGNLSHYVSATSSARALSLTAKARERAVASLPGHFELLKKYRASARV